MKQRKLILCLLALLGSITVHAYDFDQNGVYYNITDATAKTVEVTYVEFGEGNADFYYGTVTVPNRVSKDGVTYTVTIGDYAFNYCANLTSVNIGDNVTDIGNGAFIGCSSLTDINLASGITFIGDYAFDSCRSLTSITLPRGITSIGDGAFNDCSSLTSITLPSGITSIGDGAFKHCSSLTSITLPSGITSINAQTFNGCSSLTSITLPSSITTIGNSAFASCSSLTDINMASGITSIGDGAFSFCSSLTSITLPSDITSIGDGAFLCCSSLTSITLPSGLTSIGDSAFYGCSSLTDITLPSGITTIGGWAFIGCSSLTDITLPSGITSIGSQAFYGCSSLSSITLPSAVTSIGERSFYSCVNLKSLFVSSETPPTIGANAIENTPVSVFVPNASVETYQSADGWSAYADRIKPMTGWTFTAPVSCGDGTVDLTFTVTNSQPWEVEVSQGDATIAGELIIPATVTYNDMTFAVKAVKYEGFMTWNDTPYSVVLPEGLTTIWDRGFSSSNVTAVTLPSTLTDIYQGAFMNCTSLADITLPEALTKITLASFQNTPSLKSINLPEGITTIEDHAFRGSGIESIKFPTTLTNVGIAAFRECALKTLDFNGCTAEIEAEAFIGTAIEELHIPETIMLKGWTNFGWCPQLKTIEMRNMNQTAHHDVFKACSKLETVILPHVDVMTAGYLVDCPNLQSVTFLSGDAGDKPYFRNFSGTPADVLFTVPEGTAESFLKKGYRNLSDKSGLPLVKAEFEAEVARITAMADGLSDGDKTALNAAISEARTAVQATDDYLTVYAQIEATKSAARTYLTTATLTRDFDVTAATIVNPDIDRFHIGWQLGWAANGGYKTGAFTNGDVAIENFVESFPDTEGNIFSQTIKRLPAGIYRLEADVIAANQHDASATVTGVSLFAGSERTAVATENQKPQHFSVRFVNPIAKDVAVGISVAAGANASWVAMDNVRLIYDGKTADIPQGIDLASDDDARVYLYNVETGKYLSAGHAWGTHAILDSEGLPLRLTKDEETGLWQVYFWEGSSNQQLLFRDGNENDANVWVDYNGQGDDLTWWNITEAGDGSYLIQNKTLLDTESYLGNDPTHQDLQKEYTGVSYTDVIATASAGQNSHWLLFSKEQGEQLSAKSRLLAAIMRMEASGTANAELLASAQAVYYDAAATTTEVVAATTLLNSQMGMPTQDAPIDMTALIVNPRFENNTTEGWTGATAVNGRADATSNQEQEFYETNFNMYQTITGVPNGRYKLKWKGFHRPGWHDNTVNDYMAGANNASAVVYANDVEKTMLHIATAENSTALDETDKENYGYRYPHTMEAVRKYFDAGYYADSVEVEVTDNVLTIGVKNTEPMASYHWVIFSDFELSILENEEQQNNRIVVPDVQGIAGGRTTLPVQLANVRDVVSFTFSMSLPEGVSPVTKDDSNEIIIKQSNRTPMTILGTLQADGTCRFAAMPNGNAIAQGGGQVFSFSLLCGSDMELGDYEIRVSDVRIVTDELLRIQPFTATSTFTVKEPESGDVNGDGETDILDATYIVYYFLGRTPADFHIEAGDYNGDGEVDILDATIIVYEYLGKATPNRAPRHMAIDPE